MSQLQFNRTTQLQLNQEIRVLVIDDDEDDYIIVRDLLQDVDRLKFEVQWVSNGQDALDTLLNQVYDVCLLDYRLGEEDGLELLPQILKQNSMLPVIFMTGQGDRILDLEAMHLGAVDYVSKGRLDGVLLERTVRYAVEHAQNIAQLRYYTAKLEAQNDELDAYNRTIAHDLSSPINLIAGYASLIEMSEEDDIIPEVREWASKICTCTQKMSDMINQLLWLAQLRDPLESAESINLLPYIESALSRFENEIENKHIKIDVQPNLPNVLGLGAWIEEVFANLIGNGIKYLGEDNLNPHLQIRATRHGNFVFCEVEDNGIGIKPEDQDRLFDMFTRVSSQTERIKGLGLGLAIVRRIVTRLGGEVGLESTYGQGSTFWFTLPYPSDAESLLLT